jgi:hypothetical protein
MANSIGSNPTIGLTLPVKTVHAPAVSAAKTAEVQDSSPKEELISTGQSSSVASGPKVIQLECGTLYQSEKGEILQSPSGLRFEQSGANVQLQIPGLGEIRTVETGDAVRLVGPGGCPVDQLRADDGTQIGYSFQQGDGTKVSVDLRDMRYTLQNKSNTLLQSFDHSGGQFIVVESEYRTGPKQFEKFTKEVYISADGSIPGDNPDQVRYAGNKISFTNPGGHTVTRELMSTEGAKPLAAPKVSSGAPTAILAEDPTISPTASQGSEMLSLITKGMQNPDSVERVKCDNGSVVLSEGPVQMTCLPNGVAVGFNRDTGEAYSLDFSSGTPAPESVQPAVLESIVNQQGKPELRITSQNALGEVYTTYSDSRDVLVQAEGGKLTQWLKPNGSQVLAMQVGEGLRTIEIGANGSVVSPGGIGLDTDIPNSAKLNCLVASDGTKLKLPIAIDRDELAARAQKLTQAAEVASKFRPAGNWKLQNRLETTTPDAPSNEAPQPSADFGDLPIPPGEDGSIYPVPGQEQQPVHRSLMQKFGHWLNPDRSVNNPPLPPGTPGSQQGAPVASTNPFFPDQPQQPVGPGGFPDPTGMSGMPGGMGGSPYGFDPSAMGGYPSNPYQMQNDMMLRQTQQYVKLLNVQTGIGAVASMMTSFMPYPACGFFNPMMGMF